MKVHILNIKVINTHILSVSITKNRSTICGMTIWSTGHGQLRREVWHIHFLTGVIFWFFLNGNNSPKPTAA